MRDASCGRRSAAVVRGEGSPCRYRQERAAVVADDGVQRGSAAASRQSQLGLRLDVREVQPVSGCRAVR